MNNYKLIFGLLLVLFIPIFISAQAEKETKETVEKFYKLYRTRSGLFSTHELNLLKGWFTPNLTNLFRNEIKREDEFIRKNPSDKPYFGDGFPFKPYEECVVNEKIVPNKLEIGKTEISGNKALIEVMFYVPTECEEQVENKLIDTYKIELIKTKNRWQINDWIYNDGHILTEILKRKDY